MEEAIRGHVRERGYRRVTHGLFLRGPVLADEQEEWLQRLHAWLLLLPDDAVFSGLTAARLFGWWTPQLPDWVPIFASVPYGERAPRRSGIVMSRLRRPVQQPARQVRDLPVDAPAEVLLRCARELGLIDMVPMVEHALKCGHVTREEIHAITESRRAGCRLLREALRLADPRTESPWESVLRLFHQVLEVPVDVQVDLHDEDGVFVARGDLRVRGTPFLHEYDGAVHREPSVHQEDLRRDRAIVASGLVRRGFTAVDLLARSAATMKEIDNAVGRRSDMARLRRWRALVDVSTLSPVGRERLRNRWVRERGRTEYVRTVA